MFSVTSVIFLFVGVVFVLIGIVHRWVLMNWYLEMSESNWFFWGRSVPYIKSREGRMEFVKYESKAFFVLGFIPLIVGGVLIPFSYNIQVLMLLIWFVLMFGAMIGLRSHFIDVASEINRKHWRAQKRPIRVCKNVVERYGKT